MEDTNGYLGKPLETCFPEAFLTDRKLEFLLVKKNYVQMIHS